MSYRRAVLVYFVLVVICAAAWFTLRNRRDRELSALARISTPLNPWRPRLTVYQVDNWQLVPRQTFPNEKAWKRHLDDVDAVQREQVPILKLLVSRGISVVLLEGMTPDDAEGRDRQVKTLFAQEKDQQNIRAKLEYAQRLLRLAKTKEAREPARKAIRLAEELIQQHREQMLALGAPCRALVAGVDLDILPLEEEATNARAGVDDPEGRRRRHESMVEKIVEAHESGESAVVVVLGADHDLSEELKETGTRIKYVRLTVPKVRELMDE